MAQVKISEVMTKDIVTVRSTSLLSRVADLFDKNSFHHIPVVDKGNLVGMISSTDVDRARTGVSLFNNPKLEDYNKALFETMMASDIMTSNVEQLQSSDDIREAYKKFRSNKFHAIPIVDKDEVVGIVTPLDLLDYFFIQMNK